MKKPESVLKEKSVNQDLTTTNGLLKFFFVFFLISTLFCIILAMLSGGHSWKLQLFHSNGYSDMFMDFFNSIRDASAKNVYTDRKNIYPPLSLLIFKFFGAFVSKDLKILHNKDRLKLQYDQNCMIVFFIFAIICILLMTKILNRYVENLNKKQNKNITSHTFITFLLVISYPVMYCIERGNIIILSVALTMFYIFFKDSESKVIKELSYIALAIAAGIKLYPAIFGILLLIEKKYKDAVRLIIYGIIFVVFPFIFFIDFDKSTLSISSGSISAITGSQYSAIAASSSSPIASIIKNLISFATKNKNKLNFSSVSIQNFVFFFDRDNSKLASIFTIITEFIAVAGLLFTKKKWQQVFLVSYLMLNIPSASSTYSLAFLIIPFFMFLYDDEGNGYPSTNRPKTDWFYVICYSLLFAPLPMFWYYYQAQAKEVFATFGLALQTRTNQLIAFVVFQAMFICLIAEIFSKLLKSKKAVDAIYSETSICAESTETVATEISKKTLDSNSESETNENYEESQ